MSELITFFLIWISFNLLVAALIWRRVIVMPRGSDRAVKLLRVVDHASNTSHALNCILKISTDGCDAKAASDLLLQPCGLNVSRISVANLYIPMC
jgi:hypothetical protein